MANCVLELEKHDAGEENVGLSGEVERVEEGHLTARISQDPVLLVFSVRDLAAVNFLIVLHLEKCAADGCTDKVALELGDLCGDLLDSG